MVAGLVRAGRTAASAVVGAVRADGTPTSERPRTVAGAERAGGATIGAAGAIAGLGSGEAPDLRLAGLAVAAWLTALAGLHLSAGRTLLVAAVAAGLAGLAALHLLGVAGRPGAVARRYGWIAVAVLIGVVCGGATTSARLAVRDAEPLRALVDERARVTAELVVRDDPRPVRGGIVGRPPTLLVRAKLVTVTGPAGQRVTAPARVLVLASDPAWRGLLPGQRFTAEGRLAEPRGGDLTGAVLLAVGPPDRHGAPSALQRAAGRLRAGLQQACAPLPDEPGGLLPGLVVGDTSRLPDTVEEDFRATGMTHLNAVSGSNVAIIVGAVLLVARWARAGPALAATLCGLALVGFVILVRPSPSVVRAATMGAIGLAALAAGRPRAAVPALAAAVAVLVLVDPDLAGDAGFALSVLATGGLLLLAPSWRDGLRRRGVPPGAAEALAVPAAAQLACSPVIAGLSGTVSLVAVPANLLVVPAIAPATVLGVVAATVSPIWPYGAELTAWLAHWPAWWLVLVARYGARLPAGNLPWPGGVSGALLLAALTVVLLVAARRPVVRRLVAVLTVAVMLGTVPVRVVAPGWPPKGWVIAVCAVGQGDTVVLPVAAGRAVVVDTGPDPAAADACLRRLDVRQVPLLVISHFHVDHTGGVAGVLRGRRVDTVLTPQWPEPAIGRDLVHTAAATHGTPVVAAPAGWRYRAGTADLVVLGPPYPMRGTRSDPNNNSLVLLATVAGVRILLTGDAETEEQQALREHLPPHGLRADVLKVAHHGSAYQDPAFLDAIRPAVALVPVGAGNTYGHPNEAVLARLSRGGARVLRTDIDGDIAVVLGPSGLAVVSGGVDLSRAKP
ncbi:ComEC/Rec2 family competence protein [Micromonospora sp. NPDC051296]|uniref:ComEC/Rec2 family competence protein n=1 Tax=Micromonospora sp. NPDC051296 TaxID=3155046 RepID=UPI00343DAA76